MPESEEEVRTEQNPPEGVEMVWRPGMTEANYKALLRLLFDPVADGTRDESE